MAAWCSGCFKHMTTDEAIKHRCPEASTLAIIAIGFPLVMGLLALVALAKSGLL